MSPPMTDLKPEDRDFEERLKLIPAYLRAAPMWREPHPYGGAPDVANEQYAKDIETALSLLADRARMEKAHQALVDDLVAKANEARALAADLHNKPAKAHLTDPALGRMAYAMAAKCDHFIEAAEIARQALGASQ